MSFRRAFIILAIGMLTLGQGIASSKAGITPELPPAEPIPAQAKDICRAIMTQAFETLQDSCQDVARNTACYGNTFVEATPFDTAQLLSFAAPGDKAALKKIKLLATSPLDIDRGTWGISLLKFQADIPDTLPGQNITFVLYGQTTLEKVVDSSSTDDAGKMRAFYFRSGLGDPECKSLPLDGAIIRSPQGMKVTFTMNGVQISIASMIAVRATPHKTLDIELLEGHASVSTSLGGQILQPGEMVSVPLGGMQGLDAVGAPTAPVTAPSNTSLQDMADLVTKVDQNQSGIAPLGGPTSKGSKSRSGALPPGQQKQAQNDKNNKDKQQKDKQDKSDHGKDDHGGDDKGGKKGK